MNNLISAALAAGNTPALFVGLGILLVILLFLIANIKIVAQAQVYVIERLGSYHATWQTGPHFLVPFLDRVAKRVSLKENVVDFPPQPVITKDNVTMQIDTIVFYLVSDPKLFTYGIDRPISAIENLTATTLRNIIGDMDLEATLTSRDTINSQITAMLDEATDKWGIKVTRVELKNIMPPRDIQDSMEKQMKAERERREAILQAEGRKKSQILIAEGEKESQILRAQADKEAAILRAEAEKEKQIREAEGEAEAIMMVQKALADSLRVLSDANPSEKVLTLKSLEALQKVADGRATKLIIPSELQNLTSLIAAAKETVADVTAVKEK
ncbi:MAG: SPFH/Band 7/PHB domain protein [Oscillospiraceae bacterium]|jgi:regulator of protease activity HflC (stomatin/prohibitin superfamily)|nr:SPFH/Band 7/PHB domain protein [Oscillospiraceae bacterium]